MTSDSILDRTIVDLGSVTDEVEQMASTLERLAKEPTGATREQVASASDRARSIHGRMRNLEQGLNLAKADQDVVRDGA